MSLGQMRRFFHALGRQNVVCCVRATTAVRCVALLLKLHECGLVDKVVVLVLQRCLADFLFTRLDISMLGCHGSFGLVPIRTIFCNGWERSVVLTAVATLVNSFAESIIVGVINGHLVLAARWKIGRLGKLFLRLNVLGITLGVARIISLVITAGHGDLDAATASWTHFALPIARHSLI